MVLVCCMRCYANINQGYEFRTRIWVFFTNRSLATKALRDGTTKWLHIGLLPGTGRGVCCNTYKSILRTEKRRQRRTQSTRKLTATAESIVKELQYVLWLTPSISLSFLRVSLRIAQPKVQCCAIGVESRECSTELVLLALQVYYLSPDAVDNRRIPLLETLSKTTSRQSKYIKKFPIHWLFAKAWTNAPGSLLFASFKRCMEDIFAVLSECWNSRSLCVRGPASRWNKKLIFSNAFMAAEAHENMATSGNDL